jgi:uncharacterized membrane protein
MPFDVTGAAARGREARRIRRLWLLPPLLLALAMLASAWAWPHLPDGMPTHWGFRGEATNLMPKGFAVAVVPGLMLWIGFLTAAVVWSASRTREGRDLPAWLSPAVTSAALGVMLLLHLVILAVGLGYGVSVPFVTSLLVGALFIGLGWATRGVPPNPVFGIRTPRTLSCPDAWRRANRVGGSWMMGAGIVTIAAAPLPGGWPMGILIASILAACVAGLRAARRVPADAVPADAGAGRGPEGRRA